MEIGRHVRDMVKKISDLCDVCQEYAHTPRRFILTIGTKDLRFNHDVQVDAMFLQKLPVLRMVDTETEFCSESFLGTQSTRDICKYMLSQWMIMYAGPPDNLTLHQGNILRWQKCEKMQNLR